MVVIIIMAFVQCFPDNTLRLLHVLSHLVSKTEKVALLPRGKPRFRVREVPKVLGLVSWGSEPAEDPSYLS